MPTYREKNCEMSKIFLFKYEICQLTVFFNIKFAILFGGNTGSLQMELDGFIPISYLRTNAFGISHFINVRWAQQARNGETSKR